MSLRVIVPRLQSVFASPNTWVEGANAGRTPYATHWGVFYLSTHIGGCHGKSEWILRWYNYGVNTLGTTNRFYVLLRTLFRYLLLASALTLSVWLLVIAAAL